MCFINFFVVKNRVGADHGQEEQQNALELNGREPQVLEVNGTHADYEFNRHSSESRCKYDIYSVNCFKDERRVCIVRDIFLVDLGDNLLTGASLYMNQFMAMLMKKTYSSLRAWILSLIQLILPVVFLILAIIVVRSMKANYDLPPMDLTLTKYDHPVTVMGGNHAKNVYASHYKNFVQITSQQILIDANEFNQSVSEYVWQKVRFFFNVFVK